MSTIRVFSTADALETDFIAIRRLLDRAFDGDFSAQDWEHALGGWHVVVVVADAGVALAHAAVVPRTLRVADRSMRAGYVEAVGTLPERQRGGLGSLAMAEVSTLLHNEFEIGALSTGAHEFYARFGWERWQGPTFVRRGSDLARTEDDDDGVMVLRFGASRDIDLTAQLSCEERPGDDW